MKPAEAVKMNEIGVTFSPIQYAARTLTADSRILTSLYEADIDYELFDPKKVISHKKIVFYSGNQWISRQAHEHLRSYVESGGVLVAFRNFPRKDDDFNPCNLIGFHEPNRILFEFKKRFSLSLEKSHSIDVVSSVFSFGAVKGHPIRADLDNYGIHTVGYLKTLGKGKILHLGVEPSRELLLEILRFFDIPIYSNSPTRDVKTALFRRGKSHYVVAVNNGREDKSVSISFSIPGRKFKRFRVANLFDHSIRDYVTQKHQASFSSEIPRKDGQIFEIKLGS
jgi:hypothetical protein